ncbi:DUF775 domain protein [Rutstroemia sp. NJR-2017a BVV2]|nr:DUF775 domain protein [Rutstroemia sp. NJR-2017a BVV2]
MLCANAPLWNKKLRTMEQPAPLPQLFGIIPTGLPPITTPTAAPTPTSFAYTLPPRTPPYHHICVFLLPGVTLPPDTAAAVYISLSNSSSSASSTPNFKFLGGIGPGKESAIYKIQLPSNSNPEIDMDAISPLSTTHPAAEITIGISIESTASVSAQISSLSSHNQSSSSPTFSQQLVLSRPQTQTTTLLLAQRIIKNAFHFLASFSGNMENGVEVVPLKAFEEWWRKFEGRVRNDPGFLERGGDGD